ncbi:MAG: KTSC domain-containing protein [Solirubrobacterales bacterium]
MQAVTSSWIAAIGYDDAREVHVELIEGATYVYEQVPPVIWRAFVAADSKGRFVNAVLKPYFPWREA